MDAVEVNPEKLWGTPVFRGTRVPVQTVFDYILDGHNVAQFLLHFPEVSKQQVDEVIQRASETDVVALA